MRDLEEKVYIGKVFKRSYSITKEEKEKGEKVCKLMNEKAVLYKTETGGFAYLSDLQKKSDYNEVDRIEMTDCCEYTKNGILVMPAISLSELEIQTESFGSDGTLGLFVDSDSLVAYNSIINTKRR